MLFNEELGIERAETTEKKMIPDFVVLRCRHFRLCRLKKIFLIA